MSDNLSAHDYSGIEQTMIALSQANRQLARAKEIIVAQRCVLEKLFWRHPPLAPLEGPEYEAMRAALTLSLNEPKKQE